MPSLEDGGIVRLDPAGQETARLTASDPRIQGSFGAGLTHNQDGDVLAVVYGEIGGAPDRVIRWSPDEDLVLEVFTGSGPFRLGTLALDGSGEVLVPDADPTGGRVCRVSDQRCVNPCPLTQLPPRAIQAYGAP